MTSTTAWIGGNLNGTNTLAWASASFTAANFNSLASGSAAVSAAINNSAALDPYMDVSFSVVVGGTTTATSQMTLYLLPLNQDGTTYGDGNSGGGATLPNAQYMAAPALNVKSGVASGGAVTGTFRGIILPPGQFVLVLANQLGVTLGGAAAAAVQQRTYRENLAA
jgi:hypothetical protein